MAVTWTLTRQNPGDAIVTVHPAIVKRSQGGAASTAYSGAYRAVVVSAVSAGTYVVGGDTDFAAKAAAVGITYVEAVLLIADTAPAAIGGQPFFDPATRTMKFYTTAGAEAAGAAAEAGTFRMLILGKG